MKTALRIIGVVLGLSALAAVLGCQTPTSDPDAAARTLILSTTWVSDQSYDTTDSSHFILRFVTGGNLYINGALETNSWSLKNGVLTVTGSLGTFTTASPDLSSTHLYLYYGSATVLCHLVPLGS